MDNVLAGVSILSTAILFGGMVFFTVCMAPLIFVKLDADVAGRFIRQVFPWYYLFIVSLSGLASLCVVFRAIPEAAALATVALASLFARQMLMPAINRARDAELTGDKAMSRRFSRLHRLSVWINVGQIVVLGMVLVRLTLPAMG